MAEIISIFGNELGYSHVVCGDCNHNSFHVWTDEIDGVEKFIFLVCEKCGNEIPVDIQPVWGPKGGK